MGNSINYRLTLKLDNSINTEMMNDLKKELVDEFNNVETSRSTVVFSNEDDNETVVLANDLMIIDLSDFELDRDLPQYLEKVVLSLKKNNFIQLNSAKLVLLSVIEEASMLSSFPFGLEKNYENKLSELSGNIGVNVNQMGLKFSLDEYIWHYEIEILPAFNSSFILKMECFYDIEDYDDDEIPYLTLEEILTFIPQHKSFLINNFSKQFITFK